MNDGDTVSPPGSGSLQGNAPEARQDGPVRLRNMRESDLNRVLEIERASFPEPWSRSAFLTVRTWPDCCCIVAVIDDCLQGYAVAWIEGEEYHLGNIAVAAGFRKRGLGSALISRIIEKAGRCNARTLYLEVRKSNAETIAFYRKYGFVTTGYRNDYYPGGETAVVMERDVLNSAGSFSCRQGMIGRSGPDYR